MPVGSSGTSVAVTAPLAAMRPSREWRQSTEKPERTSPDIASNNSGAYQTSGNHGTSMCRPLPASIPATSANMADQRLPRAMRPRDHGGRNQQEQLLGIDQRMQQLPGKSGDARYRLMGRLDCGTRQNDQGDCAEEPYAARK
ncbi:MAG: hypothetical protein R3D29_10530 [Nitratireductor sp.]